MEKSKLLYKVHQQVATITLNSPENLNGFDERMLDEIVNALKKAESAPEIKVIVVTSSSQVFSAGGDIKTMYQGIKDDNLNFEQSISKMASVSIAIKKTTKPVICAVQGAVAGAAFNVVLAADLVIAAENATFLQAFVKIGLIPDAGGLYLLTRAVGVNKAMELALLGSPVTAVEGKRLGFVTKLTTTAELVKETNKLAQKVAAGPSQAYAEMKRLVFEAEFKNFEEYVKEEVASQRICGETNDFHEGIVAFIEKRPPVFE